MKKYKKNIIQSNISVGNALRILNKCFYKCLIVVNNNKIVGTISDGDIRRALIKKIKLSTKINKIMKKKILFFFQKKYSISKVKNILNNKEANIDLIPIVDNKKNIIKIISKDDLKIKKKNRDSFNISTKVIIMAGGKGTRLLPVTNVIPKPLIPINKKTLIENILDKFVLNNFSEFLISINYKSYLLKSFFKEIRGKYKIKFIEEKKPLGTAGALNLIKNEKNIKNYFITNCDSIFKTNLNLILKKHINSKKILTVVACDKKYNISYGVCNFDKRGNFVGLKEKPNLSTLVNTGMYIANKKIFKFFKKQRRVDMDVIINLLALNKEVNIVKISNNSWTDIGQWPEYKNFVTKNLNK
tara:strand:+ start:48777 stop:49847 length:1071 start_codon:yes stop_codon:yes gene_type:complete